VTVAFESRIFRMPQLGPENPLPAVGVAAENPYQFTGDIPHEILDGARYGSPPNLFPYTEQNGYDRALSTRTLQTVVLQNDRLRAVFLPELGGRLWELTDLVRGKTLLHSPDTIQFANLALRNAWFAGGIEWNIGTRGHSPTTCSPLHTAVLRTPDGTDVLRMWEFDRLRGVVFQLDAWLPNDSPVLLVAIRLRNPNAHEVPMYWWSNAAVPEDAGSRVVAPAHSAFATMYTGAVSRVSPMDDDGVDCTWPARNRRARDFFFDIDAGRSPWIVNADADGDGLAMVSTRRLRGRKLFVWGQSTGGQSWQNWLSPDGGRYAEIQAGLAQTQFQHLPMPAASEWSWLEAYGNVAAEPAAAHGADWDSAVEHVQARVNALVSPDLLEAGLAASRSWADTVPHEHVLRGSGWGALEGAARRRDGEPWLDTTGTPFSSETITAEQQPWLELLEGRPFAGSRSFVAGARWEERLAREPDNPHALLHRAVMAHARGDVRARALYKRVGEHGGERTGERRDEHRGARTGDAESHIRAIAERGLALLARADSASDAALRHYARACELDPHNASLLVEAADTALRAGQPDYVIRMIDAAPGITMLRGRIQLLLARALHAAGQPGQRERAAALLSAGFEVADLREGDDPLAALWRAVFIDAPVPDRYRFSMNDEE
jgi:hypothetical protein